MDNDDNIGSFYMGRTESSAEPKRLLPPGMLTTIALLALLGIIWYAYPRGEYTDVDVPVVKADTAPIKAEPTEPGGMEVRHQDSTVFEPLEKNAAGEVERLLPAPEEPVNKEQAINAAAGEKPDMPATEEPKLNLDLQMKDAGDGVEKIVPVQAELPPELVTPAEPQVAAAPTEKVETPKSEPTAETVKPPAAPEVSGTYKVQLGSYREVEGAKKDWAKLKKKYPALLGNLAMKTVEVDLPLKGIYHRLYAVNISEARAKEICAALESANSGGCLIVKK